ncbi:unnamed protein product [Scytosiphon promiscuus]
MCGGIFFLNTFPIVEVYVSLRLSLPSLSLSLFVRVLLVAVVPRAHSLGGGHLFWARFDYCKSPVSRTHELPSKGGIRMELSRYETSSGMFATDLTRALAHGGGRSVSHGETMPR